MARMSLVLADLGQMLNDFQHEPRILQPHDARMICEILKQLSQQARTIENQLGAKLSRDDVAEAKLIASAASLPGSNVKLFPVIPRPFSDGQPGGRA